MGYVTGGFTPSCHVCPPSCEVANWATVSVLTAFRSPPPRMPFVASRKATLNGPALGELCSGVSYAAQVLPPSSVARTRATLAPPVAIHALLVPCAAMHVPLA